MPPASRPTRPRKPPSRARNTALFSTLTGVSRLAGLLREVLVSAFFGLGPAINAFTYALAIPNVVRSLFADSALSAAFVPAFTELQEQGKRREAFQLASTLLVVAFGALAIITVLFVATAGLIVPLVTPGKLASVESLVVGFSRVLFPIVLVLGLNGVVVGMLQAHDHFTIPALSALVWNLVIIGFLAVAQVALDGNAELYAYAAGIVVATVVQLLMSIPMLRRIGFRFDPAVALTDPRIARIFKTMVPATLGLGLINFNALINYSLAGHVTASGPRAVEAAFRLYMLPQGIFSVAVSTILFPHFARLVTQGDHAGLGRAIAGGLRLIGLSLIPAAAVTIALADPLTQLTYQRGSFSTGDTQLVGLALFWFAFSLPFSGINLLLTRSFFSLRRPWTVALLSVGNLVVNVSASLLLLPFGLGGVVAGTAVADAALAIGQLWLLARLLGDGHLPLMTVARGAGAALIAAGLFGIVAYAIRASMSVSATAGLLSQVVSLGLAIAGGAAVYAIALWMMRVPEARRAMGHAGRWTAARRG